MSYVVQAKPDDLTQIASEFKKQEDAVGEMQKGLARMNDKLKQGWIGLGSEAYFQESESLVMPSVQRLADALGEASRVIAAIGNQFGQADQQASSGFKSDQSGGGNNTQPTANSTPQTTQAQQQAAAAAGGAQSGGIGGAGAAHAASRVQSAGFGSSGYSSGTSDLMSRSADLGHSVAPHGAMASSQDWLSHTKAADPFRPPNDFDRSSLGSSSYDPSSFGSGSGSGGGGGGGGGVGGGGGGGSVLGALRGQAGTGFGLGGIVSNGPPDLTYSGLGGFGGTGGPRPPDFGVPLAIAAISPFAALLGKVVKDRTGGD